MESSTSTAISIRLDETARRDLRTLEKTGLTRSEAIRLGLRVAAERLRHREAIRAEAARLAENQEDRQEMLEVAAMMESLRGEG
ncbi:MAG: hypothetical protein KGJ10_09095 [Acidobacteriota bacterium]|nr:hypothetical protein [Acidobacteriota bacterium]MDE3044961.1 hypothetical protein [Acidobacteriota bacterium]